MASIKDAIIMWCQHDKPNKFEKYAVDGIITEDDVKQLQNDGLGHIVRKISDVKKKGSLGSTLMTSREGSLDLKI